MPTPAQIAAGLKDTQKSVLRQFDPTDNKLNIYSVFIGAWDQYDEVISTMPTLIRGDAEGWALTDLGVSVRNALPAREPSHA